MAGHHAVVFLLAPAQGQKFVRVFAYARVLHVRGEVFQHRMEGGAPCFGYVHEHYGGGVLRFFARLSPNSTNLYARHPIHVD